MKLPGDTTPDTDPIGFAISFVAAMRRQKGLTHPPSVRTTVAIPRFLSARWFWTRQLAPRDYVDAAVLCTVAEDQAVAARVARELLFPKRDEPGAAAAATAGASATAPSPAAAPDAARSILEDLASLDIDVDAIQTLGDVDALLEQADRGAFRSFDFYESLHASADPADRALGQLLGRFGGAPELEASGIASREAAAQFAREHLRAKIGELAPEDVAAGCAAGFASVLLAEARHPWELAGAYAGAREVAGLGAHLDDVLRTGSTRDIGRTLKFLEPHAGMLKGSEITAFRQTGLSRARDLSDHAELLDGLGRFIPPAPELVVQSAVHNVTRALEAARWLERTFGEPLQARVFEHWADAQKATPALETLVDLAVPAKRWEGLLDDAYSVYVAELAKHAKWEIS